ncbi:MAG TPA: hypothetical protein VKW09_15330 [bacterium]|nr:hypothetical protein [bacterium]
MQIGLKVTTQELQSIENEPGRPSHAWGKAMSGPARISTVLTILLGVLTLGLQPIASAPMPSAAHSIVGSWMTYPLGVPGHVQATPSLFSYTSDGVVTLASSTPGTSGGHGVWVDTGNRTATATFYLLLHNPGGDFIGVRKFRMKAMLDTTFDAYTASGKFDFIDPQGKVVQSVNFTTRGSRIKVESP